MRSVPTNPRNGHAAIKIIPTVTGQDDTSSDVGWIYNQLDGEFMPFDG